MKLHRTLTALLVGLAATLLPTHAAETVHLYLKANGTDIPGDSTKHSLGRADTIECVAFNFEVYPEQEVQTGRSTGRSRYEPIRIIKRIDRSSPLLLKALTQNENIDARFRFYRPNPIGDGTTEQFYTIEIAQARIVGVRTWVPNVIDPATAAMPEFEEVSFVFNTINWTFEPGGVTHQDVVDP